MKYQPKDWVSYFGAMAKKGTLSQHFVTHVVPPLQRAWGDEANGGVVSSRFRPLTRLVGKFSKSKVNQKKKKSPYPVLWCSGTLRYSSWLARYG